MVDDKAHVVATIVTLVKIGMWLDEVILVVIVVAFTNGFKGGLPSQGPFP